MEFVVFKGQKYEVKTKIMLRAKRDKELTYMQMRNLNIKDFDGFEVL
ncbi:MAG: hypothetical protein KGD68_12130 [Candidatus Lokiarchaeota archaeon]|nr:hypothetical protein [Candidatus Lokiarchaeota archaeon]